MPSEKEYYQRQLVNLNNTDNKNNLNKTPNSSLHLIFKKTEGFELLSFDLFNLNY